MEKVKGSLPFHKIIHRNGTIQIAAEACLTFTLSYGRLDRSDSIGRGKHTTGRVRCTVGTNVSCSQELLPDFFDTDVTVFDSPKDRIVGGSSRYRPFGRSSCIQMHRITNHIAEETKRERRHLLAHTVINSHSTCSQNFTE